MSGRPAALRKAAWPWCRACGPPSPAFPAPRPSAWRPTGSSSVAVDASRTFKPINIAVLTISDTRELADDTSGDILSERIKGAGHNLVSRAIERDDVPQIVSRLNNWIDDNRVDCIITTGGTGLTGRDVTPEALDRVKD